MTRALTTLLHLALALGGLWTGVVTLVAWTASGTVPGARSWTDTWPLVLLLVALVLGAAAWLTPREDEGAPRTGLLAGVSLVWAFTVTRVAGLPPVATAESLGLGPAAAPVFLVLGLALGLFLVGLGPGFGLRSRERPLLVLVVAAAANGKLLAAEPDVGLALVTLTALLAASLLVGHEPLAVCRARLLRRLGTPLALLVPALLLWWLVASFAAHNADSAWRLTWRLVGMALAALACLAAVPDERAPVVARRILDGLVLGLGLTLVLACVGVLEAAGTFPMADVLASRLRILGGNPNLMGAYLALGIPLSLGWLFAVGQVSLARRFLGALLVAGLVTALYLTRSRSAFLGAAVGGGLFLGAFALPWARGLLSRHGTRLLAGGAVVVALTVGVVVSPLGADLRADLDARAQTQSALGQRWHFWRMAGAATADNPVTGLGPANFAGHAQYAEPSYYDGTVQTWHTHNLFLAALEGGGYVGLLLFSAWLVAFLGLLTRVAGASGGLGPGPAIGLWAAALGLLAANQLDLGQSQLTFVPHVWWLSLVVAGLSVPATPRDRAAEAPTGAAPSPLAALVLVLLAWPAGLSLLAGYGLFDLARVAAAEDDHARAVALGEAAASPLVEADTFLLHGQLARWNLKVGKDERYLEALEEGAERNPLSSPGWYRLALAQLRAGLGERAVKPADRAFAMDPRGVGGPKARLLQAWVALEQDRPEDAGELLLEALAGGAKIPDGMPVREVQAPDGEGDLMLLVADGRQVSLLGLLRGLGEELVERSADDALHARRAIPGMAEGFHHIGRPLEAAGYVGRMAEAMDDPIRSIYYAWLELLVEGGAVDEAREVLAASPYRDEPSMRDLFPVEGGAPGAAAAQPAVYGADLFYTHGRLGDLFLEQALLQVEAGDRAAAERTLAQALYVSSDAIERAGLAHTFLARTPGTKAEKRRDLVRYLDAASLSRANLKHPRRMGDAARELLKQSGGDATKARELLTELIADKPLLRDPLGAALDGVLTLRAGR